MSTKKAVTSNPPREYRFERKFVSDQMNVREVERVLLFHPALFREIYHQRDINNIYLDTPGWRNLCDSVEGSSERLKTRVRWYGDLYGEISSPVLEFKSKKGLLVSKTSFRLNQMIFQRTTDLRGGKHLFEVSDLPDEVSQQLRHSRPVLINRYSRKYYLSADSRFRVTVDTPLMGCRIGPRASKIHHFKVDCNRIIIELKHSVDDACSADQISQRFPFRLTRWSKYVSGLMDDYEG